MKHQNESQINSVQKNQIISNDLTTSDTPFLKDHGFRQLTVLPGSMYLELAVQEYIKFLGDLPRGYIKASFNNIFLVGEDKGGSMILDYKVEDDQVNFQFLSKDRTINYAEVQIQNGENIQSEAVEHSSIDRSRLKKELDKIDAETFYQVLAENGNQYGPSFQIIETIYIGESQCLGFVSLDESLNQSAFKYHLHPIVIDSLAQVTAGLSLHSGKTFVLKGFEGMVLKDYPQDDFFCYVELMSKETAKLQAYDKKGRILFEADKILFDLISNEDSKAGSEKITGINIVSNYTAEPIEESITFWSSKLKLKSKVNFSPYNQIFQELLNPNSAFNQQEPALNVVLLSLETWGEQGNALLPKVNPEQLKSELEGHQTYMLPFGAEIAHLNRYETEYVFNEIFIDKSYLKHGITIEDGDCIIDIGANIGLFTLFASQQSTGSSIYCYEPSPVVFKILETNSKLYGEQVHCFNYGVSDRRKEAQFTFYEKSSVFSSFEADENLDRDAIRAVVLNMLRDTANESTGSLDHFVDEIIEGRLASNKLNCQLVSVSDIIEDNQLSRIDLLKIDAEKSELDILRGIKDEYWRIIKQIVIEVHDTQGRVISEIKDILTKRGFEFFIEEETLLKHSGLYNVFAIRPDSVNSVKRSFTTVHQNIAELRKALQEAASHSENPFLVLSCSPSEKINEESTLYNHFKELESQLKGALNGIENVFCMDSDEISYYYPVNVYFDSQQNELGHIPYTNEYFAALGTLISRKLRSMQTKPYKVIALDCDNTLWSGVVGEDGPTGIKVSHEFTFLQEFIIKLVEKGFILCLVSKNREQDVMEVFEVLPDMPLKKEHIVSSRINWEPKSSNLLSIAKELNLGLDSFIFIDDNPVECAEVMANLPEVLTLQLPKQTDLIPKFLDHVWAFDQLKVTSEDRKRTKMYQENILRDKFYQSVPKLEDFIKGLELQVEIVHMEEHDLPRVSQLTQRTNQFNFTTIRRSVPELQNLIESRDLSCLTVRVADRFGEYGLVGVVLYKLFDDKIQVDTMLLSCRVLGKGVEHQMIRKLGSIGVSENVSTIALTYKESNRNDPALKFLNEIPNYEQKDISGGHIFMVSVSDAVSFEYVVSNKNPRKRIKLSPEVSEKQFSDERAIIREIVDKLKDAKGVLEAIGSTKNTRIRSETNWIDKPNNSRESEILSIWQQVLNTKHVGVTDNFFEAGGSSLKGVQVIAHINQRLDAKLTIVDLFENPKVADLARLLENIENPVAKQDAEQRGRSRRTIRSKRRGKPRR